MGSPSLIILLIIVVWVIVLAPLVFGSNKPIRRSGDGYDETRVLHQGGTTAVARRRRPKLTAADVHRHEPVEGEEYEVVEVADEEQVLVDDTPNLPAPIIIDAEPEPAEPEPAEPETAESAPTGGSTAYSVIRAREAAAAAAEEEQQHYDAAETYLDPSDFGYESADADGPEGEAAEVSEAAEAELDGADIDGAEVDSAELDSAELDDADLAFAEARRGRGGYDPRRDERTRADRYKRRQRTFLGLLIADVVTVVIAVLGGGWTWLLPAIAIGLTAWFLVALNKVVKQERALRQRRMRQLRRARLGVDSEQHPGVKHTDRMRAGAVILDIDDESPDFDHLPRYRQPDPVPGGPHRDYDVYDDYDRAS